MTHPPALLNARLFSLGALVLLYGGGLTWATCDGAFCASVRRLLEDTCSHCDYGEDPYSAGVHLFELVPALLALGGTALSLVKRDEAGLAAAWKAWRASAALQWAVMPVLWFYILANSANRGVSPDSVRAVTANLMLASLALVDPERSRGWWARLVPVCGGVLALIACSWGFVVRA